MKDKNRLNRLDLWVFIGTGNSDSETDFLLNICAIS